METKRFVSKNQPKCNDDTNQSRVIKFEFMGYLIEWDLDKYFGSTAEGIGRNQVLADYITVLGQVKQPD